MKLPTNVVNPSGFSKCGRSLVLGMGAIVSWVRQRLWAARMRERDWREASTSIMVGTCTFEVAHFTGGMARGSRTVRMTAAAVLAIARAVARR